MWDGYLTAATEFIAAHDDVTAYVVIDRFHVAKQYRDAFDKLRKQELKRLKQDLSDETYTADCKGMPWILRKNHTALTPSERIRLRRLLGHSSQLHQAYTLREELTALFNQAQTTQHAERWLLAWIEKVVHSDVRCFDKFLNTLRNHWPSILNYFCDRVTSGFVEGLNNKIKTIKRRCYGIRKVTTLFQRLWLDLEGFAHFSSDSPMPVNPMDSR